MADNSGETITMTKSTLYLFIIGILGLLLVASIMTQGFGIIKSPSGAISPGGTSPPGVNPSGTNPPPANPGQAKTLKMPIKLQDSPVLGQTNSPFSLIEFSDFQCPFCGISWGKSYSPRYAAITGTVSKFKTDYVNTGKANLRVFTVAFLGQESVDAANAAQCAKEQGKFWEMHDAIFSAQTQEENNGKYKPDKLKDLAKGITGLDTAKFNACVDTNKYASDVQTITNDWQTVSVANTGQAGTPTFWVLIDASKVDKSKVARAASSAGYEFGLSDDQKTYIILASPEYERLKAFMDSVLA